MAFGRSAAVLPAIQPAEMRPTYLPATPARSHPAGSLSQVPQRMTDGGLRSAMRSELHPTPRQTGSRPRFGHVSFESPVPRMAAAWQLPEAASQLAPPFHPPSTPISTGSGMGVDAGDAQGAGQTPYRVSVGSASVGSASSTMNAPDLVSDVQLAAEGASASIIAAQLALTSSAQLTSPSQPAVATAALSWTTGAGEREMDIMAKFLSQMLHSAFSSDFPAAPEGAQALLGSDTHPLDADVYRSEGEVLGFVQPIAEEAVATPMPMNNRWAGPLPGLPTILFV